MRFIKNFNDVNESTKLKKLVFLGGTCAGSTWRENIIKKLKIDYFNPVVKNWDDEAKQRELDARGTADYLLYVITPRMKGVYSIAEVTEDAVKQPTKTIFCYLTKDIDDDGEDIVFTAEQKNSLNEVGNLVERNGAKYFKSIAEVVDYLNE